MHTPGPWRIAGKGTIRKGDNEWIASVHWRNRQPNARLIAAAPDMLREIKAAERWLSGMHSDADGDEITELRDVHSAAWECIDQIRAVIAKAEGK